MDDETLPPSIPGPSAPETDEALFAALLRADRSETLGALAAGIGRELNELLATILGAVATAQSGDDIAMDDAEQACIAARELTRRLLVMGRGGDGSRAIVETREILIEAAKAAGAGSVAEIVVDVPDGVAPVLVERMQILQAFQNLLRNALEAMPPPPHRPRVQLRAANTELETDRIEGLPAGSYVEFEVRDNAAGIAPEQLEAIWDPYFTTKKHRTGLGLPAALAIVRRHGGQIGVDSTVGDGTVFTIFLPAADTGGEPQGKRAPSERFRTGRVLVMDDDAKIAARTGAMLESLDYRFDLARNGSEAIDWYRRYFSVGRPYDAIILDLDVVGGMGGREAFEELRLLDPDVRAIASHAGGDEESRQCLDQGFCGCLAKPYRPADLGKLLGTVLG